MTSRERVEQIRRSLVMIHDDDQAALSRSQALELMAAVEEADRELRRLRDGLVALLEGGEP